MFGVRWWIGLGVENVLELVTLLACLVVILVVGGVDVLELFRIALVLVFGCSKCVLWCCGLVVVVLLCWARFRRFEVRA